MIEKYKEITKEIKSIEDNNKKLETLRKEKFEFKKQSKFCLKLFGLLFLIPILISTLRFFEIESVFIFSEYLDNSIAMIISFLPFLATIFSPIIYGNIFKKKMEAQPFLKAFLFSIVVLFIYYSVLNPNIVYFLSSGFLLISAFHFFDMGLSEKHHSKKAEGSEEKLALLKKERSLIIDKIMNDSAYLKKLLSNKEEDKTMREIYSNITKEKEWKEQLLTLSKKESIDCLENT
jgi:hypothetical protein